MYRMDIVLSLILLQMLKFPRAKVQFHFLKKTAFVTSQCLAQDTFGKCSRITENLSKYTSMREQLCAEIFLFSRIFYNAFLVCELYQLPRCIALYKQSLSELRNNLCDHLFTPKRLMLHFTNPLVKKTGIQMFVSDSFVTRNDNATFYFLIFLNLKRKQHFYTDISWNYLLLNMGAR